MKDITKKIDALKAAFDDPSREPTDAETKIAAHIAFDFVGELVANSRRIAKALEDCSGALEQIDLNLRPGNRG